MADNVFSLDLHAEPTAFIDIGGEKKSVPVGKFYDDIGTKEFGEDFDGFMRTTFRSWLADNAAIDVANLSGLTLISIYNWLMELSLDHMKEQARLREEKKSTD